MGFIKILLFISLVCSNLFAVSLEIGSNLKSNKKLYKLTKNRGLERVSIPIIKFNNALSFGSYIEMPKTTRSHFLGRVDGGLMMRIRF
ncbi:hypothetical protein [Helicobacter cetorum]|uniref:Uncharacterized protein n=1 Tax=Helicobacter cetorum (strain ATCC BAA-540 / CCUG 52418 / MIT 99-5656) TaxID=1163745 RepID=I0EQP6_HELCM|nr:hypothetical protein [Helicobacter cetorum]AFI05265.1 hypothetical protein HCD_01165 [Helicobacter cetorum MIT 99-5656]